MNFEGLIDAGFRGCCMITRGQEVVFDMAAGYSDLANKTENRLETKFATASAGKVFVATAILQLVERGLLGLDDTLGGLLDIDLKRIDPDVTVEQLLTHTSGVPDYFDESVMEEYEELWVDYPNYRIRSNSDLLPLFIDKPMMYPRGERFQYNNTGYVLLAMILERLTGKPFDVCLRESVFEPCGMESTGYYEMDRLPAGCASSYIYDEQRGQYRTNIYAVDAKGTGAGGAFTTVGDISRFWTGLLSHKLLSREMTDRMLNLHSGKEGDGYYGYGLWLSKNDDGSFCPYFQGSDPGVSFMSLHDFRHDITVTLVSNYNDSVWKAMRSIRGSLSKG